MRGYTVTQSLKMNFCCMSKSRATVPLWRSGDGVLHPGALLHWGGSTFVHGQEQWRFGDHWRWWNVNFQIASISPGARWWASPEDVHPLLLSGLTNASDLEPTLMKGPDLQHDLSISLHRWCLTGWVQSALCCCLLKIPASVVYCVSIRIQRGFL